MRDANKFKTGGGGNKDSLMLQLTRLSLKEEGGKIFPSYFFIMESLWK